MGTKEPFDILIPYYRNRSNGESDRAKAMFAAFVSGDFSYDEISNHPDYPAYASADTLKIILPLMIDEMLRRKDTINFLVYPMLSAIDPNPEKRGSSEEYKERSARFISLADKAVINKICEFLDALKPEPPIDDEEFARLTKFWHDRALR